jgi:hypothetical protein
VITRQKTVGFLRTLKNFTTNNQLVNGKLKLTFTTENPLGMAEFQWEMNPLPIEDGIEGYFIYVPVVDENTRRFYGAEYEGLRAFMEKLAAERGIVIPAWMDTNTLCLLHELGHTRTIRRFWTEKRGWKGKIGEQRAALTLDVMLAGKDTAARDEAMQQYFALPEELAATEWALTEGLKLKNLNGLNKAVKKYFELLG